MAHQVVLDGVLGTAQVAVVARAQLARLAHVDLQAGKRTKLGLDDALGPVSKQ